MKIPEITEEEPLIEFRYDKEGNFNETPFEDPNALVDIYDKQAVSKIPFSIMGVQAEIPSKESNYVTQGSQVTKLVTMDFLEAGVPIDFETKDSKGTIEGTFPKLNFLACLL